MKTTELFVELIVIGVGASSACLFLILTLLPGTTTAIASAGPMLIIPALAMIYLFGILTDRAADTIFGYILRKWYFPQKDANNWKKTRDDILEKNEFLAERWNYAKSRIRIVRGWALNAIILSPVSVAFLLTKNCSVSNAHAAVIFGIGFVLLAIACYIVWVIMSKNEIAIFNTIINEMGKTK